MNNNKFNELQNRREFFKKAAKASLPVLSAIVLANAPIISNATENEAMGCINYCKGECMNTCKGTCSNGCKTGCFEGCRTGCKTTCKNGCKRNVKY